ncbi:MAG: PAS domain S-box protein [Anaerolineae bacterium]|nr:PAS domain S-box protein [Anaerolineae bacterium]
MSLRRFWHRISQPNPALQSLYEQQQAHLLSSILAALLLAGLVIIPIWILSNPQYPTAAPLGAGLYIGLCVAYRLSRSIYYTIGAWLLIVTIFLLVISILLTAPSVLPERMLVINFFAICILLASLLLSVRATILIALLSLLVIVPYFFVPGIRFPITYSFFVFTVITSALVLTSTVIRRNQVRRLQASEERYRVLLEAIPDLMFRFDRAGTHLDYYAGSQEMLAYEPNTFMGKTIREVLPHDMAEPYTQAIEKVLATGQMVVYEYSLMLGGSEAFFEARMVQCAPDEVLTIVRNVTERHRNEIALKQSEERFSTAFRNSPVPMVISTTDPTNSIYIEANDAYLKLVGYTWDELKGHSLTQLGITIQDERRETRLATLDSHGYYALREIQLYNRHDEIRDVLISAQRIVIDGIECDLELLLDVTEQRRLEKKAVELEMEAKNVQILSKFIQDASHEFRTPLADISNRVYLLTSATDPAKRQRHADQAQKQIQALTNLLDILFTMARLDSGLPFETALTDLNSFLRTLLSVYELQLHANKLTLKVELAPDLPSVPIHEELLQQAIRQVMDNAIRYNTPGGAITVKTETTPQAVVMTFTDTGIGISSDDLPRVFERFWRHDAAHTTPGFGLGLSIARRILQQHGGDITLTSPGSDQGTTVTLTLPLRRASTPKTPNAAVARQPT